MNLKPQHNRNEKGAMASTFFRFFDISEGLSRRNLSLLVSVYVSALFVFSSEIALAADSSFFSNCMRLIVTAARGGPFNIKSDLKVVLKSQEYLTPFDREILTANLQDIYSKLKSTSARKIFQQTLMHMDGNSKLRSTIFAAIVSEDWNSDSAEAWARHFESLPHEQLGQTVAFTYQRMSDWSVESHRDKIDRFNGIVSSAIIDPKEKLYHQIRVTKRGALAPWGSWLGTIASDGLKLALNSSTGLVDRILPDGQDAVSLNSIQKQSLEKLVYRSIDPDGGKSRGRVRPFEIDDYSSSKWALSDSKPITEVDLLKRGVMSDLHREWRKQIINAFGLISERTADYETASKEVMSNLPMFASDKFNIDELVNGLAALRISEGLLDAKADDLRWIERQAVDSEPHSNRRSYVKQMNIRNWNQAMMGFAIQQIRVMEPIEYSFALTKELTVIADSEGAIVYVGPDAHRLIRGSGLFAFRIAIGYRPETYRSDFEVSHIDQPMSLSDGQFNAARYATIGFARSLTNLSDYHGAIGLKRLTE